MLKAKICITWQQPYWRNVGGIKLTDRAVNNMFFVCLCMARVERARRRKSKEHHITKHYYR